MTDKAIRIVTTQTTFDIMVSQEELNDINLQLDDSSMATVDFAGQARLTREHLIGYIDINEASGRANQKSSDSSSDDDDDDRSRNRGRQENPGRGRDIEPPRRRGF